MKSTSIHSLNADRGLSKPNKLLYLFLNWVNNLFPYREVDPRIEFKDYDTLAWRKEWDKTYPQSSVGRRLSDIFWRALPWQAIKEELGETHVFDTGCGSGNYGERLMAASGGLLGSYTGIDAREHSNWDTLKTKYPNFTFLKSNSSDIRSLIPAEANLFITQSAIEHFDEDLAFFEQVKEHIGKHKGPVIQIHNFPARAILPLYLFHGLRQYTPRTASKITRLFADAGVYLYGLGGRAAKRVQWKHFTWPLLIMRRKATWSDDVVAYDAEVRKAVEHDVLRKNRNPLFWVMIIHSNMKHKIW